MSLALNKILKYFCFACLAIFIAPFPALAQSGDSLTLTISPPLVKVKMNPGGRYDSFVRVVNNNSHKVSIYVQAQDFRSNDQGAAEFVPAGEEADYKYSLAQWLEFNQGPIEIPAQESQDVPFTINLPEEAEPGGHYAALLIGTKPPENISGTGIKVSSMLASLVMLEVSGDVLVRGEIREFSTDKKFYDEPRVEFTVNFANTGNVHLQPRGEINVYNMLNREAGKIEINRNTEFGNVLPQSGRKWEFSWADKREFFNMGRYRAVLLLGYNGEGGAASSQALSFWVIYPKPLLLATGGLLALIILTVFLIRRYVKKAVLRAQANLGMVVPPPHKTLHKISVIPEDNGPREDRPSVKAEPPDLGEPETKDEMSDAKKIFLAGLSALVFVVGAVYLLVFFNVINIDNFGWAERKAAVDSSKEGTTDSKSEKKPESADFSGDAEVEIIKIEPEEKEESGKTVAIDEDSSGGTPVIEEGGSEPEKPAPSIIVLNGSGVAGTAVRAEKVLTAAGLAVRSIGNADNYDYLNTIVKYKPVARATAEKIAGIIAGEVELEEIKDGDADTIVIIGKSFK